MRRMGRSKIGYLGIGADGRPITEYHGWAPGGMGCSGGCDGCWARRLAKRMACPDCRAFRVHLHEERLPQPANTKKPGVVLCNFTNDWLDNHRPSLDVLSMRVRMERHTQHIYVTLTKNANRLRSLRMEGRPHIYHGLTIRDQPDADRLLPDFLGIPGNKWVSYEPAWGHVNWLDNSEGLIWPMAEAVARGECFGGIICGHDNRKGAPGTDTLDHIRSAVQQCDAAGVSVMVKQIHHDGKLLHASNPAEFALFPKDLQRNRLPWSMPT